MNTSIQTRVPRGVEVRELTPDEVQKYHRMYFATDWRDTLPACCGPCDQGRKTCPTPEACGQPEPLTSRDMRTVYGFIAAPLVAAVVVAVAFWIK